MSRYSRQEVLPEIGVDGQQMLKKAVVTIVGVGALGSTTAELLARAGVGTIIMLDRDLVEISNLQRQTLYSESDIGRPKAVVAESNLKNINSSINVSGHCIDLNHKTVDMLQGLVLDCSDNLTTRFLIDEYCIKHEMKWIHSAAIGRTGRVWVYQPGGPTYRCFTGEAKQLETCETAGVLNGLVTMIASIQTNEAIKILTHQEAEKKLLAIDIWNNTIQKISVKKNANTPALNGVFEYLNGKGFKEVQRICSSRRYEFHMELDLEKVRSHWELLGDFIDRQQALQMDDLWVFEDGRVLVKAESEDEARAKISKFIGD